MMDFAEMKRDVCWYLVALALASAFLVAVYYSFFPRLSGAVTAASFIFLALAVFYSEPEDSYAAVAASLFASILPLGYAMAESPFGRDSFYLLTRLYIFGFALIGFSWTARLLMDWLDDKEKERNSPDRPPG